MWLTFDGIANARDLGGTPTTDGRRVKPGRLLRGAALDLASDADIARLENELHLRHVIDLRDRGECRERPNRPVPGAETHNFGVLPEPPTKAPSMDTVPDFPALFKRIYGKLAVNEVTVAAYTNMFQVLLGCEEGAVYFHCAQGKDRTGIAALLILTALGVDEETAKEDYFLSNIGLKDAMADPASMGVRPWPEEVIRQLFTVFPESLNAYLDGVRETCGSLEGYLRRRIGLTDADFARLRALYLE